MSSSKLVGKDMATVDTTRPVSVVQEVSAMTTALEELKKCANPECKTPAEMAVKMETVGVTKAKGDFMTLSILGMLAGYLGGWVDNVLIVITDSMQAFPSIMLALALLSLLEPSMQNLILVIAISYTPGYARIVRAQVLAIRESQYIEVERAFGATDLRIAMVHIFPNILAPLFILLAMDLPTAITTEAGLSFLGLGVRPPTPSWGVILNEGFQKIRISYWPVLAASLTLMITTLGFTLFGETLRDILDPRLTGSRRV